MARLLSALGTAFVAVGFVCAPLAAFSTFVLYVLVGGTRGNVAISVVVGVVVAVTVAAALVFVYARRYQTAAEVNTKQYHDLTDRLRSAVNLLVVCPDQSAAQGLAHQARTSADQLVADLQDPTTGLLASRGSGWLAGESYLEVWDDIYGIEEAVIVIAPLAEVLTMARRDRARLDGSKIPNADHLLTWLDSAIDLINPPVPGAAAGHDEMQGRKDVQSIRSLINRYRADEWAALVAERNRTLLAAGLAGILAYLGLLAVVVWHIDPKALLVGVSFAITGALVSLLHQATRVGGSDSGIEDFGQSTARLLTATFVSGIIAVLGIIVVEGGTLSVNGVPLLTGFQHWKDTFDWTTNKGGFFIAALFGFAPSLLFDALQRRADDIKSNLDTSQATGRSGK